MSENRTIEMPASLVFFGSLAERMPAIWQRLGQLETKSIAENLEKTAIREPLYVAGIARSGSTILLEFLAEHPEVATHQYRDFPFLFTPLWWNRFLEIAGAKDGTPTERAHKDRIMVTSKSPEAMEEALWMRFFSHIHDPARLNVLSPDDRQEGFDRFYQDHIRKVLYLRGGSRYVAKNNYNLTRLAYLKSLFPDVRFVIPVRDPVSHIASLVKQHRLFCREEERDRRILRHMARLGHFEFGLNRRSLNVGDGKAREIERLWEDGEEVRGSARLWASLYGHVAEALAGDAGLREATFIVHYDDLCSDGRAVLEKLYAHVSLAVDEAYLDKQAARLSKPSYYDFGFSAQDIAVIEEETKDVHERFRQMARA